MEMLKLGFNSEDLPVRLTNNTASNDFCTSYYFKKAGEYFLLWIEHQNPDFREDPDSPRYVISCAVNEGNEVSPEIYEDTSKSDLFRSNDVDQLIAYFKE